MCDTYRSKLIEADKKSKETLASIPVWDTFPTTEELKDLYQALSKYYEKEFQDGDFDIDYMLKNLDDLGMAYTELELVEGSGELFEIQVSVDAKRCCWLNYVDRRLVKVEQRNSLRELINEINVCCFDRLVEDCADYGRALYPRYLVEDRESGNAFEEADSLDEALEIIKGYEAEDKEEGTYTEDFYSVRDRLTDEIVF